MNEIHAPQDLLDFAWSFALYIFMHGNHNPYHVLIVLLVSYMGLINLIVHFLSSQKLRGFKGPKILLKKAP